MGIPLDDALLEHLQTLSFEELEAFEFADGEEDDDIDVEEHPEHAPKTSYGTISALDMMRHSCAFFASEVLQGPPQAPYNGRFLIADHHQQWDDLLHKYNRICVNAPRDHGKTFFFDFALPIWKAYFQTNGRGYIFSATQAQASRILSDIVEEIESNPKLRWLIPEKKKHWGTTGVTLSNGHKIYARGYGTKIRGAHPDWIVVDDGLNDEDAYSELVRQKHIDYFYTAISNMIIPGGVIVVVGTPFHAADLYADLAKNQKYHFAKYPAVNADGTALWPSRYCATDKDRKLLADSGIIVESLESKKLEIGSIRFTREFLCDPISDDMSIFPGKLFAGEPVEQMNVRLGMPASFWKEVGVHSLFIGVDLAISTSVAADYTVLFVLGLDNAGNRWVVDILRAKGLEYNQQLSLINAVGRKYDPDLIFIESNQMQRVFGDELIRTTDLPIFKFYTTGKGSVRAQAYNLPKGNTVTSNKNSLEGGVPSLRTLLENRKIRIPRGDARSVEVTDTWIEEMKHFTWLDGKLQGVGSHDDTVMAFWIADQAVRRGGSLFSGSEDESEGSLDDLLAEMTKEPEKTAQEVLDPAIAAMLRESNGGAGASGNLVDDDILDPGFGEWDTTGGFSPF